MLGPVALPNAARALFLPARPGGASSRDGGRASNTLAVRPACVSGPKMAPQRLETIEAAPGNGIASEASTPNSWYAGGIAERFAHRRNITASLV
jgi:hypothetical protein